MAMRRQPVMLRDLLPAYGITTITALARRMGMSHQQAWNLWHGYAGVGSTMMRRLHERVGMPLEELIQLVPPPSTPRGRPRKPMRPTASIICSGVTLVGSYCTVAVFSSKLTSAWTTPSSLSKARLTFGSQLYHTIPSTRRCAVASVECSRIVYTDLDTSFCKEIGEGHGKAASTHRDLGRREGHHWHSLPSLSATNPL